MLVINFLSLENILLHDFNLFCRERVVPPAAGIRFSVEGSDQLDQLEPSLPD